MSRTTAFMLGLSLGIVLVGCGEDPIPADPGYAADVQPILMAHCVRCHGGGGKLNADPAVLEPLLRDPPSQGYFDAYEDRGTCMPVAALDCKRGAAHYSAGLPLMKIQAYLHPPPEFLPMPPPPAPALTERELEILDRWLAKSPPKL